LLANDTTDFPFLAIDTNIDALEKWATKAPDWQLMIIGDVFLQSSDIVLLRPLLDRLEANCADSGISLALGHLLALYSEASPAIAHYKRAIKHFPRCWDLKESLFLALESSYQPD
jgi:hypothetical protein